MKINIVIIIALYFATCAIVSADEIDYKLEFGIVIHNDLGEPVGFRETKNIPISLPGKTSMYGIVITTPKKGTFTLGSVHVLPTKQNQITKIMGKAMKIEHKGAVFMRTNSKDLPGEYQMEIYIDGLLYEVINYQLIQSI